MMVSNDMPSAPACRAANSNLPAISISRTPGRIDFKACRYTFAPSITASRMRFSSSASLIMRCRMIRPEVAFHSIRRGTSCFICAAAVTVVSSASNPIAAPLRLPTIFVASISSGPAEITTRAPTTSSRACWVYLPSVKNTRRPARNRSSPLLPVYPQRYRRFAGCVTTNPSRSSSTNVCWNRFCRPE